MKYVAYYRVSSIKQGRSGLSLEAQRQTVLTFIQHNGNQLIGEYTEVESGKNDKRPQLNNAINLCKNEGATLVVAKLDRLYRDVYFTTKLMKDKVKFVCCDMPDANDLTVHILAAVAEQERIWISERTKAALAAKRQKDPSWKPGTNNLTDEGRAKAWATTGRRAREALASRHALHFIKPLREQGVSYRKIASLLNTEDYKTRTGKHFTHTQVYNIWKRFQEKA